MSMQDPSVMAHAAPGPEEPTLGSGKIRSMIKRLLHNGIDTPVRFLQSLRVGRGSMANFDPQDGAIIANGSAAKFVMGDQGATGASNYAIWRYQNAMVYLDSQFSSGQYQIGTQVLSTWMQKSLRVGTGTGLAGYDGADGAIVGSGAAAGLYLGSRAAPTGGEWFAVYDPGGQLNIGSDNALTHFILRRADSAALLRTSLRVGTSAALAGNDGQDGAIVVSGAAAAYFYGDRATPSSTDMGGLFMQGSGTHFLWDNVNGTWMNYTRSNKYIDVYGNISLSHQSANRLEFGNQGVAPPGANSAGQKIQLYGTPGTVSSGDFGIGIESANMWFNSGGGCKWYYGSSVIMTLNNPGQLVLDPNNQTGNNNAQQLQFGNTNTGIGSNRSGTGGGVNTDANQLGIDFWTQSTRIASFTYNGYLRLGYGSGLIANQPQYNNSILGIFRAGGPGAAAASEHFHQAWSTTTDSWDMMTISYYNVIGTNTWSSFAWIFGRNVNGAARNGGPYLVQMPAGWGINNPNPAAMFHVQGASYFAGAINKAGGGFLIDHPLKPDTHDLYHNWIEGPRADLLYRGKVRLVAGRATVSLDTDSVHPGAPDMTPGTFAALTRNAEVVSLLNQTGFDACRVDGQIVDGRFEIVCQNPASTDTVAWVVMAERNDPWHNSDDNADSTSDGYAILERDKKEAPAGMVAAIGQDTYHEVEGDTALPDPDTVDMVELSGYRGYPRHPEAIGRKHPVRRRVYRRKE